MITIELLSCNNLTRTSDLRLVNFMVQILVTGEKGMDPEFLAEVVQGLSEGFVMVLPKWIIHLEVELSVQYQENFC